MAKVKHHRGWEYWLDRGNHRYIAVKFDGDGEQASDCLEADEEDEVIRLIDAAEEPGPAPADEILVVGPVDEEGGGGCPACGGEGVKWLAELGSKTHCCCRDCGIVYIWTYRLI